MHKSINETTEPLVRQTLSTTVSIAQPTERATLLQGATTDHYALGKQLLNKAFPIVTNRLITAVGGFVGAILLAQYGEDELVACTYITPAQLILVVVGGASLNAIGVVVGRRYGAIQRHEINLREGRNAEQAAAKIIELKDEIAQYFIQSSLLSLATSLPVMPIMWYSGDLFKLMGVSAASADIISDYFRAFMWGVPASAWGVVARQHTLSINLVGMNIKIGMVGLISSLGLGYLLTFGNSSIHWLPNAPLKTAGLGYACSISAWLMLALYLASFKTNSVIHEYTPLALSRDRVKQSLPLLKDLWSIGWPIMGQIGGEVGLIFVSLLFINHFHSRNIQQDLAAQNILTQYQSILVAYPFAISQACSILVSQAQGRKKFNEMIAVGKIASMVTTSIALVLFATLSAARLQLAKPFLLNNHSAQAIEDRFAIPMIILAAGHVFDVLRHMSTGYLRGLADTRRPMQMNLGVLWVVGCSLSWALGIEAGLDLSGLGIANDIAIICAVGLLAHRTYHKTAEITHPQENRVETENTRSTEGPRSWSPCSFWGSWRRTPNANEPSIGDTNRAVPVVSL